MLLQSNQFVWTAQDEVERMLSVDGLTNVGRQRQLARTAIMTVLRDLPNRSRWTYYDRRFTLRTVAQDSSVTCEYDHTGGSSERLLTIASGTLPTDGTGEFYRVVIDSVHYGIARVLTSTTAQLDVNNNPGSDVTAGTACVLYRAYYPMPVGFRKLAHVWDVDQEEEMRVIASDELHSQSISIFDDPGTPEFCSLQNFGESLSTMALVFSPPPSEARTYDVMYEAGPAPVSLWKYSDGKVSTSTVTATLSDGGVTAASMVGAVIRFSGGTSAEPTSEVGTQERDNPYLYQRMIIAQPSSSTLTLDSSIATLTNVKYTISSPLDIEYGAMLTAFQMMCDAEFSRLMRKKTASEDFLAAERALRLAMEADRRTTYARDTTPLYDKFRKATVTTE